MDETVVNVVYAVVLVVVLAGSLIVRRRVSLGTFLRNALAWLAIAAGLLLAYSFKDEFTAGFNRTFAELLPYRGIATEDSVMFRARRDGHFVVEARVDGKTVRFLLDTGASDVILSPADAERLGMDLSRLRFDIPYQSANGRVMAAAVTLSEVAIGPIVLANVRAAVNGAPMAESLLGMSFLGRLKGWRIDGDRLTLSR